VKQRDVHLSFVEGFSRKYQDKPYKPDLTPYYTLVRFHLRGEMIQLDVCSFDRLCVNLSFTGLGGLANDPPLYHIQKLWQLFEKDIGEAHASERKPKRILF